jgi:di/tricarboxylate transporter
VEDGTSIREHTTRTQLFLATKGPACALLSTLRSVRGPKLAHPGGACHPAPPTMEFDPAHIVLATLAVSLVLFVTDALRYDLIALAVAVVLAATQVLSPEQTFAGLASPAVMLVGSMYVFGAAMTRSGLAEALGERFLSTSSGGETGLIVRIVLISGLLSSVLSNAGVVAILIPVCSNLAQKRRIAVSRLMMPLAYGSLLGGLVTVIATSKNLAVNGVLEQAGESQFTLFEFSHYGLILLACGCVYFLGPGRWLLPKGRVDESLSEHYQVREFVTEVLIEPSSTLINRSLAGADFFGTQHVSVLGIVRPDSTSVLAPGPYNRLRKGDTLILQGAPSAIVGLREKLGLKQVESAKVGDAQLHSADVQLVEAVIPAGSSLVGQSLVDADFVQRTALNVMALSHSGAVDNDSFNRTPLDVGDALLIQGHERDIERARRSREVLILGSHETTAPGRTALLSVAVLLVVLLVGFLQWMPLSVAAVGGAIVLVIAGAVPSKEVYRVIDWQTLMLIGGMLALGEAFQSSGLADALADRFEALTPSLGNPYMVVASLMLATAALTQVTTHIAAAVIMAPVALSIANRLGIDDRALVMSVLTGASLAFMSPVAHQANAMVMGPGDYRYRDYLRVGTPLTIFLFVVATALLPLLWPLETLAP